MTDTKDTVNTHLTNRMETVLRSVDLNLLTVFDAVMQEQNITRAAHNLGMSQPAVSNAVARLKVMFSDELFIRQGRGIQPTQRARQLFIPIRQALQLIRNQLPSADFAAETSVRQFNLSLCSPCDMRFAPRIMAYIHQHAPEVKLHLDAEFDSQIAGRMRNQTVDVVIDYRSFNAQGVQNVELFKDELVVVASKCHPRIQQAITVEALLNERHAKLSQVNGDQAISEQAYQGVDIAAYYEGTSLSNLLYVIGQSELISIAPRWVVENAANKELLQIIATPLSNKTISGYLSWHESNEKDQGHIWLRDRLMEVCREMK
ncbi:transcriptional regulator LeuO [Vibrio kasasachensis]|uniref:transcriptional regulator LeuO n=1 Tax=Vibrio kasasachensis TaxID=2910248 RepID=UPI003D0C4CFC